MTTGTSLPAEPFVGVVILHELLDALPFRRLVRRGSEWRELAVDVRRDPFEWTETPARPVLGRPAPDDGEEGTILEISEASEGWIREAADRLVEGEILAVDYGADERELLNRGSRGTLATVRHHESGHDALDAPGSADLSAFVNWTRIRDAARRAGLHEVAFRSLAEALGAWGFAEELERAIRFAGSPEAEVRVRLTAKNLLFGFQAFSVLELGPASS